MGTIEFYIGAYDLSPYVKGLDYVLERQIRTALVRVYLGEYDRRAALGIENTLRPRIAELRLKEPLKFNPVFISFEGFAVYFGGVYSGQFEIRLRRLETGMLNREIVRLYYSYRCAPLLKDGQLVLSMQLSANSPKQLGISSV